MNYLNSILVGLIITPIAFFIGYKLRPITTKKKRLITGFAVAFTILTMLLSIDLLIPTINILKTGIATAIAVGFPLGLGGPPYKED
ncbi:hypothetical protein Desgi_3175 [Desulfoscipio gibsoniae DSM 7213]|uniref:Uncharacterized protein n=1 Tax=Desulfoscipio gibsoniae DSM 7213 TaxID=767817 RepID=R4KPP2_9FIRM|nr:hypothetical protein [Desulfoscipio gibsoniae]AGL02530.1 hypothetical protein Desgi_3175 [Desulfoscipio gibsoniae DSM 7213]